MADCGPDRLHARPNITSVEYRRNVSPSKAASSAIALAWAKLAEVCVDRGLNGSPVDAESLVQVPLLRAA